MKPEFQWCEPVEIEAARTSDYTFKFYKPNGKAAAIDADAVVRFKLSDGDNASTPLLDIDSVDPLDGDSVITIVDRGEDEVTAAQVTVRFAQDDTADLTPGVDYFGEIGVVDTAETNPANAFKRAGYGPVTINQSPGGDVGLT